MAGLNTGLSWYFYKSTSWENVYSVLTKEADALKWFLFLKKLQ